MKHIMRIPAVLQIAVAVLLFANVPPASAELVPNLTTNIYAEPHSRTTLDKAPYMNGDLWVDGKQLDTAEQYVYRHEEGVIMVPLRAVAEQLGVAVGWDEKSYTVRVGDILLQIGSDWYTAAGLAKIPFGPPPELIGESTYVPLTFFKYALTGYDAYLADDGKVIVETISKIAETETVIWREPDNVASAWFARNAYGLLGEDEFYYDCMRVGESPDGGDVFALLRLPLGGEYLASEITSARLWMKMAQSAPPAYLYVGSITRAWIPNYLDMEEAESIIDPTSFILTEVTVEEDGWVSIPVTDFIKTWMGGDKPNYGFALYGVPGEPLAAFAADVSEQGDRPYLSASGAVGERPTGYGLFGFTGFPFAELPEYGGGNCLSYALRDTNPIYIDDLGGEYDEINRLNIAYGVDAVAEYIAKLTESYVAAHCNELRVSGFRRIESYETRIDPTREYRIALRVGCTGTRELPADERYGFDYHLWAQLSDGRWIQKFPIDFPEIIPGTGPGIPPDKYLWNGARQWAFAKAQEFYNSEIIYFAVTKDTDQFTQH